MLGCTVQWNLNITNLYIIITNPSYNKHYYFHPSNSNIYEKELCLQQNLVIANRFYQVISRLHSRCSDISRYSLYSTSMDHAKNCNASFQAKTAKKSSKPAKTEKASGSAKKKPKEEKSEKEVQINISIMPS